jgi:hypothetical protein
MKRNRARTQGRGDWESGSGEGRRLQLHMCECGLCLGKPANRGANWGTWAAGPRV